MCAVYVYGVCACVYVCVYACLYVCMHVCMCVYVYMWFMCVCERERGGLYVYAVYVYGVCACVYMCVYACLYVCVHVCIVYVCVHVCVCVRARMCTSSGLPFMGQASTLRPGLVLSQ